MKDYLGGKIMTKYVGLRAKTYNYLIDDSSEDKTVTGTKNCVIKRELNVRTIKTINENKIKYLEKNKINMDSYKKDHKDFIRNNKLILKTQQRFKSECIMFLLKRLIRLFLSSNDD